MRHRRPSFAALVALFIVALACYAAAGLLVRGTDQTATFTVAIPPTVTEPAPADLSLSCPPGRSFMGCAAGAPANDTTTLPNGNAGVTAPTAGCKFPDVSSYQGHPDWAAAARVICAGVAKAGEFVQDPDFAFNVHELRAQHVPWSAYWFIRSCSDGPLFVKVLQSVGFKGDRDALRPVLDMEVPAAHGCAVPVADAIHKAFGVWPIIYTAPGTWPGGSSGGLKVWEADYGSVLARLPFTAAVVAWQRYSPPYTYYYLPGIDNGRGGYGDVSIDLGGFAKSFAFPTPASTVSCRPFKAQSTTAACSRLLANEAHFTREISAQRTLLRSQHCYAHRTRGNCPAELRRGDQIHAALNREISTSHVQP